MIELCYNFQQSINPYIVWHSEGLGSLIHFLQVSGCDDFMVTAEDVAMNSQQYHAQSLSATATVTEDGTGEEFEASISTQIHRTRYSFRLVGDEKFAKPGLPYTGKVSTGKGFTQANHDQLAITVALVV